jgi:hypothetical protein
MKSRRNRIQTKRQHFTTSQAADVLIRLGVSLFKRIIAASCLMLRSVDLSRWMLAATNISFSQKVIDTRGRFLKLAERQLPFGQLPLLQIDGAFAAGY